MVELLVGKKAKFWFIDGSLQGNPGNTRPGIEQLDVFGKQSYAVKDSTNSLTIRNGSC